jgi:hypothetical protein
LKLEIVRQTICFLAFLINGKRIAIIFSDKFLKKGLVDGKCDEYFMMKDFWDVKCVYIGR